MRDIRDLVSMAASFDRAPASSVDHKWAGGPLPNRMQPKAVVKYVNRTTVTGINSEQIVGASVGRLPPQTMLRITGEITTAAQAATLTVRGDVGGTVAAGGTYLLTGTRGSVELLLERGQSLESLATRINNETAVTGIAAELAGDDLVLESIDVGSAASVRLETIEPAYSTHVDGVNASQIGRFEVVSIAPGEVETVSGSLVSAAAGAELVYHGTTGGLVAGTASFRLAGSRGAANIGFTQGEMLEAAAERINLQTAGTGISATVVGDDLYLRSNTTGAAARVQIEEIEPAYDQVVSGVNAAQVTDFRVISLDAGSEQTLAGEVVSSATRANLLLQGSASGTVIDTATFELTGSLGSTSISIAQGETLAAVAGRISAFSGSTGVTASVANNQLVLASTGVGSTATVAVDLTHVQHTIQTSGVNAQHFSSFQVNSLADGASNVLSGSITQTAGVAELTFTGGFGVVGRTATFTLSGSVGSTQISVTPLQSLASLASTVNSRTATTGVTAVVQGQQVKFRSVGVGSAATVAINVTSGTFPVTGGNGNGTANGTNAVAVVNGQTITGAGNAFAFSTAQGSYAFTAVSGFTGSFSPVSIVSQAGSFTVSGGNGNGTATGLDAQAVINGSTLTGAGNRFIVTRPGGQFELAFTAGFTGVFDAITARSVAQAFDISGGDGAGTSLGADAVVLLNGTERFASDGRFTVAGENGDYEIEFVAGFTGGFDSVTIASVAEQLEFEGETEPGLAVGSDAQGIINGQALNGEGSLFRLTVDGHPVGVRFQPGFTGAFDPITVIARKRKVVEAVPAWRPIATERPAAESTTDRASVEQPEDPLERLLAQVHDLAAAAAKSTIDEAASSLREVSR